MLDNKYPVEYLNQRLGEEQIKQRKRMMWIGKFAFPKVNTKKTKLMFVPLGYHKYTFPVLEPLSIEDFRNYLPDYFEAPKYNVIELGKRGYNGKHWRAIIRIGYNEKDDVLLVCKETFIYQKRYKLLDGSSWYL